MPWTPRFPELTFELPLIDNLKRIIERDSVEALEFVQPGIEPFARIGKAERISKSFPFVAIYPARLNVPLGEWGQPEEQQKEIFYEIANIGSDPESLKVDVEARAGALLHIVTTATLDDMLEGISTRPETGLTIGELVFEELALFETMQGKYYQRAVGSWLFQYIEDVTIQ